MSTSTSQLHSIVRHAGSVALEEYLSTLPGPGLINERDDIGRTPLYIATESSYYKAVVLLSKSKGVNVDLEDNRKRTPLFLAAANGSKDAAETLLLAGADPNQSDDRGLTPLHAAAVCGCLDVAELLLRHGAKISSLSDKKRTPLFMAAVYGHAPFVRRLLEEGADATIEDKRSENALHGAAARGHVDVAVMLIKAGVHIDSLDNYGKAPLAVAVAHGHIDCARALISHGADVTRRDTAGDTALHLAGQKSSLAMVQFIIEQAGNHFINNANKDGKTALHLAASNGKDENLIILLENGADVGSRDANSLTPMHAAVMNRHLSTVKLLAAYNADPHAADEGGCTPVVLAIALGMPEGQCFSHADVDASPSRRTKSTGRKEKKHNRRTEVYQQQQHQQELREDPQEVQRPRLASAVEDPGTSTGLNVYDMPVGNEPAREVHRLPQSSVITQQSTNLGEPVLPVVRRPLEPYQDEQQDTHDQDIESGIDTKKTEPPRNDGNDDQPYPNFRELLKEFLREQIDIKDRELKRKISPIPENETRGPVPGPPTGPKRVEPDTIEYDSAAAIDPQKSSGESSHLQSSYCFDSESFGGQSSGKHSFAIQYIHDDEHLYKIGKLGSGRFGMVHLADWYGVKVALKEFYGNDSEGNRASMNQEAKTLSMLQHPSVVHLYGVYSVNKQPSIVLEYVSGGSLKSQLRELRKDKGRMGASMNRTKVLIALQAANAINYLHSRDVIHFDLKAENFLCDLRNLSHPIVKIADVGLSKHKLDSFVSGNMRGTLPWMAPELFPRQGQYNRSHPGGVTKLVDVYSFAIVLWEIWMLGADPYPAMSAADILYRILEGNLRPTIPPECPPSWKWLMELCWHSDPEQRLSFEGIASRLNDILKNM